MFCKTVLLFSAKQLRINTTNDNQLFVYKEQLLKKKCIKTDDRYIAIFHLNNNSSHEEHNKSTIMFYD